MTLQAKPNLITTPNPLGIYVHVPFCATQCDFCAFYQEKPRRQDLERYLSGMEGEMKLRPLNRPVDTVFWGGGTPGLLPAKDLQRLGEATRVACHTAPREWTVEMAPSAVKADKVKVLLDLGVTRISMGVQSLQEETLDALGRMHSAKQVLKAYDLLREGGCDNINLDLMFAIPGQTFESWKQDLEDVMGLGPEHISTYCLTFEEDTALWVRLNKGQTERRTLEDEAQFYERTWDILESRGYAQYEISNFAKPGHACQHNLDTWSMAEWAGYGPSAASQHQGFRLTNPHSIDRWLEGVEGGKPVFEETIELKNALLAEDSLIFGLRMNQGVDWKRWQTRFPEFVANERLEGIFQDLEEKALIERTPESICLTQAGRLVADSVGEAFLGIFS